MIDEKVIEGLREYLKDHYVPKEDHSTLSSGSPIKDIRGFAASVACMRPSKALRNISHEASDYIQKNKEPESFAHALEKKRKEKDLSPVELYKRANVDRRQYSRLMGPEGRHPSMNTVLSFALALRLDRQEFDEFLKTAGYALSNSSSRDVCIMYCLETSIYDIDSVNALLFAIGITPLTRE